MPACGRQTATVLMNGTILSNDLSRVVSIESIYCSLGSVVCPHPGTPLAVKQTLHEGEDLCWLSPGFVLDLALLKTVERFQSLSTGPSPWLDA